MLLLSILLLLSYSLTSNSELVQVIQIARHAARTPLARQFQLNQYSLPPGEITSLGVVQAYYLGQEMRTRYIENTNFLPQSYDPASVLIKSSGKPRAITSVNAFINGLFPQQDGEVIINNEFTKFPVESLLPLKRKQNVLKQEDIGQVKINKTWAEQVVQVVPVQHDQTFHAEDEECPVADRLLDIINESDKVQNLEHFFQKGLYPGLLRIMSEMLGPESLKNITLNMRFARNVLDIYRCARFHRVLIPEFNPLVLDQLGALDYYYVYHMKFEEKLIRNIAVSNLLREISNFTKSAQTDQQGAPKYIFYLAHDRNLQSLATVLFPQSKIQSDVTFTLVPFSSVMTIELHKEGDVNPEYYVRIFFNDEPQIIKWCVAHQCPLDQFQFILSKFIVENVVETCNSDSII